MKTKLSRIASVLVALVVVALVAVPPDLLKAVANTEASKNSTKGVSSLSTDGHRLTSVVYSTPSLNVPVTHQATASQWVTETIDSQVWSPTIALDRYQQPRIAYSGDGLRYAILSGMQWITQVITSGYQEVSLALDTDDHPHISLVRMDEDYRWGLSYAAFDGVTWTVQMIDSGDSGIGRNSALALDSNSRPHITYYGPQPVYSMTTDFRHAYYNGSQWITETIASGAEGNGAGASWGLEIDSQGHLHTIYDGPGLTYAYFDGHQWNKREITPESVDES